MSAQISIQLLSKADFKAAIAIAESQLGAGFMTIAILEDYLAHENKIALAAVENNTVAGFALAHTCSLEDVLSLVLCDHDWFRETLSKRLPVGVLKTVAVHPAFANRSIGTQLVKARLKLLENKTKSKLAISWRHRNAISSNRILQKLDITVQHTPPPALKGKWVKIKFITQLPTHAPSFAFFCNLPQYVKDPYKRFVENQLRKKFDFRGVPLRIFFRQK